MEASTLVLRAGAGVCARLNRGAVVPMRECAMSNCREPASSVPLTVDLDYLGAVELPLCPMHVQEFEDGCDLTFVVADTEEVKV